MKKEDIKTNIEIEGIILTEEVIRLIGAFQASNNELIGITSETLADVICFLAKCMDYMEDTDSEEINMLMNGISHIRTDINKLRKP